MRFRLSVLVVMLTLLATACGGDGSGAATTSAATTSAPPPTTSSSPPTTTTAATTEGPTTTSTSDAAAFPATIEFGGAAITIPERPDRIAALSATHVEMLYAIGAGEQLIAGDLFSNYPAEASALEKLDSFNLSVEAVVALEPDLVILSFDPVEAIPALGAVGIPTMLLGTATDLEAVYAQIDALGAATGNVEGAQALIRFTQAEITDIVAAAGDAGAGATYYHETDPFSFYTPNSSSFIGGLYALLGMDNIADAAPDELGSGFPQLSPEFIITADPDYVFLAGVGETAETLAARDGWDTLSALDSGRVFVLDPDVASRWGPRVVDLLRSIADAVTGSIS